LATTAQTIIDRALRLISAIASGSSPTASETADGLTALNAMIASWQLDKLNVYAYVDTSFPLTANDASYTVGPSGNFDLTPRPTKNRTGICPQRKYRLSGGVDRLREVVRNSRQDITNRYSDICLLRAFHAHRYTTIVACA